MKLNKMLKKFTPQEIAGSVVFRKELSPEEEALANEAIREFRKLYLENETPEQKLYGDLLQIKFQMEDYLKGVHNEEYSFGHFLKRYVEVIGKLNKDFADDIGIKHTELSQLINNHRSPAEKIIVRLELHSGNVIPALLWMKVADKQREHVINTDKTIRQEQSSHVKNRLEFSH